VGGSIFLIKILDEVTPEHKTLYFNRLLLVSGGGYPQHPATPVNTPLMSKTKSVKLVNSVYFTGHARAECT